ncbi:MAG TPA: DUF861 domain-containing protein [Spirochaetia bacterium]|nr:DUF861 domain-containing protein [Spirochaetia bacterium]
MVTVQRLTEQEIAERGVRKWPIWTKEVSRFDWSYDQAEECLFLEGRVTVKTPEGNYDIGKGDFVTFQKGLSCVWEVKEPVRKHYNFS